MCGGEISQRRVVEDSGGPRASKHAIARQPRGQASISGWCRTEDASMHAGRKITPSRPERRAQARLLAQQRSAAHNPPPCLWHVGAC
eukprot:6875658-Pyramimonas_sp.AAC.1